MQCNVGAFIMPKIEEGGDLPLFTMLFLFFCKNGAKTMNYNLKNGAEHNKNNCKNGAI